MVEKQKLVPRRIVTLDCSVIQSGRSDSLDVYVVDMDQTAIFSTEHVKNKLSTASPPLKPISKEQSLSDYKDVFEGPGEFESRYHIEFDPTVKPIQRHPRRVPQALKGEIKDNIDSLVKEDVLEKVASPTDWISNMVAVKKPGKSRLCIDPTDLKLCHKESTLPDDEGRPYITKKIANASFHRHGSERRILACEAG